MGDEADGADVDSREEDGTGSARETESVILGMDIEGRRGAKAELALVGELDEDGAVGAGVGASGVGAREGLGEAADLGLGRTPDLDGEGVRAGIGEGHREGASAGVDWGRGEGAAGRGMEGSEAEGAGLGEGTLREDRESRFAFAVIFGEGGVRTLGAGVLVVNWLACHSIKLGETYDWDAFLLSEAGLANETDSARSRLRKERNSFSSLLGWRVK
jgi:hypothetical protein